ncbi:MAG: PcfK-like family protein [Anaeromicrobium sp.]|jgi:hypothetical protein|uniref:Cas9 inhibitor AcrIIA9 family protein n=1 Tax=Anaeromicrobium sp. TaxID=1929132 RepID=UPI0025DAF99C|nr:Cas9 inhibitor AcrIIA9 family protein [Anaeromicrobium sp.]MCT4593151.1 PcfK-like family protein [Anaeromicrobium sp.]
MINSAVEKLEKGLENEDKVGVPARHIIKFLIARCKTDEAFSKKVLVKEKEVEGCFNYVYEEVKKRLSGKSGWMADDEVYKIASMYFDPDDTEFDYKSINKARVENSDSIIQTKIVEQKAVTNKRTTRFTKKKNGKVINFKDQVSMFELV